MKNMFYFTIIGTNLADYCEIRLTRYWPNATLKIDYKDGSNQTIINLIGRSKDDVGCLIENDLNINETMNDEYNLIKSKYDFYDSGERERATTDGFTNTTWYAPSLTTNTNTDSTIFEFNETNFITSTSTNTKYEESTISNEDATFDASTTGTHETTESITILSIEETSTFKNEIDQSTSIFSSTQSLSTAENSLNYKVKSFFFTGILSQNIKFDDQYWLNGFRFESLSNGTIKIRVS
jgi:hypothetical protein